MTTFKKILLATDLTEASEPAVRAAFALAEKLDAELIALHVTESVYHNRIWFSPTIEKEAELLRGIDRREAEAAKQQVDDALARLGGAAAKRVRSIVLPGIPADQIPATALEIAADVIVMGTHGRTGMRHTLLGSIAERVVRTAHCPVLTVRAPRPAN